MDMTDLIDPPHNQHPGTAGVAREEIGPQPTKIERRNDELKWSESVGNRAPEVVRDGVGRPTLINTHRAKTLLEAIGLGMSLSDACKAADLGETTVFEWVRRGENRDERRGPDPVFATFAQSFRTARYAGELKLLGIIATAKHADGRPNEKAAEWILEKTRPDRYGRRLTADLNVTTDRETILAKLQGFTELPQVDEVIEVVGELEAGDSNV